MTAFDAAAAAAALLGARKSATKIAWPGGKGPSNEAEAYGVQAAMARSVGGTVPGWKVGNMLPAQQEKSGIPVVTSGALLAPWFAASPARWKLADFVVPKLECEFAFELGADLPERQAPYSRDEVADAVASLHPAIEIFDTRQAVPTPYGSFADCMASGGFVHGPGTADWRNLDLGRHALTLSLDGAVVASGTGAEILGDPFAALVYLANNPPPWAELRASAIVTKGSCIVPYAATKPGRFVADFGSLGTVELTYL